MLLAKLIPEFVKWTSTPHIDISDTAFDCRADLLAFGGTPGGDTGVRLGIRDSNLHPFRSRLPSSQHPPTPNAIPNPPSDPCEARMAMPRKVSAAVTHMEYIRRQSPPSDGFARECTNRHVCLRRRPLSWPRTLPLAEFNVKPVSSNPAPSYGCHN